MNDTALPQIGPGVSALVGEYQQAIKKANEVAEKLMKHGWVVEAHTLSRHRIGAAEFNTLTASVHASVRI